MSIKRKTLAVVLSGVSCLLSACSGGGGSSPPPTSCLDDGAAVTTSGATSQRAVGRLSPPLASDDPLFPQQWHLANTGQVNTAVAGEDINVVNVWADFLGRGQRIAIVDDGLEIAHEDLAGNVVADGSCDYTTGDSDPTGGSHGTSVAGVAAAVGFNDVGVRGVAPQADLVGFNLLQDQTTANEADAMSRDSAVAVSNNSWGPADGTGMLIPSNSLWQAGIEFALSNARNGKGTAFFWAAGNGGDDFDNSNYDGYANYHGVMSIAALNPAGRQASYSEPGANLLVAAPSGEFCDGTATPPTTVTTDRSGGLGYNNGIIASELTDADYTQCFNGTSSATPVVAGVAALALEANPNLTWRDVREVLARSARQNDVGDSDWSTNGAGLPINHKYGFGAVDAGAAVALAQGWSSLSAQQTQTLSASPALAIEDGSGSGVSPVFGAAVSNTISITGSALSAVEFVAVTFTSDHSYSGDLDITLTSPAGTVSRLHKTHACSGDCTSGFADGWRFGSLRHLGEVADGDWTLSVRDGLAGDTGSFQAWELKLYGH